MVASPSVFVNSVPIISPKEFITIIRAFLIGLPCSSKVVVTLELMSLTMFFHLSLQTLLLLNFPNLHITTLLDLIIIVKKLLIIFLFSSNHLPIFKVVFPCDKTIFLLI